jgi:hypothetical protein
MARITPKYIRVAHTYTLHTIDDDRYELVMVLQKNYKGAICPKDKDGNPKESAVMRCLENVPEDAEAKLYVNPNSSYGKKWELFDNTDE